MYVYGDFAGTGPVVWPSLSSFVVGDILMACANEDVERCVYSGRVHAWRIATGQVDTIPQTSSNHRCSYRRHTRTQSHISYAEISTQVSRVLHSTDFECPARTRHNNPKRTLRTRINFRTLRSDGLAKLNSLTNTPTHANKHTFTIPPFVRMHSTSTSLAGQIAVGFAVVMVVSSCRPSFVVRCPLSQWTLFVHVPLVCMGFCVCKHTRTELKSAARRSRCLFPDTDAGGTNRSSSSSWGTASSDRSSNALWLQVVERSSM